MKRIYLFCILMFAVFTIGCSATKKNVSKEEIRFYPEKNVINYVLDTAIEQMTMANLAHREICLIKFEMKIRDYGGKKEIQSNFVKNFENNIVKLVPFKYADAVLAIRIEHGDKEVERKNNNFKSPVQKRYRTSPKPLLVSYVSLIIPKEKSDLIPPIGIPQSKYDYSLKSKDTITTVILMVIDVETEEVIYYDKIAYMGIYRSQGFKKLTSNNLLGK